MRDDDKNKKQLNIETNFNIDVIAKIQLTEQQEDDGEKPII